MMPLEGGLQEARDGSVCLKNLSAAKYFDSFTAPETGLSFCSGRDRRDSNKAQGFHRLVCRSPLFSPLFMPSMENFVSSSCTSAVSSTIRLSAVLVFDTMFPQCDARGLVPTPGVVIRTLSIPFRLFKVKPNHHPHKHKHEHIHQGIEKIGHQLCLFVFQ